MSQNRVLWLFSVGAAAGGMVTAIALWFISGLFAWISEPVRVTALVVATAGLVAAELGALKLSLPQNARQVPQSIFYRGLGSASLQFGFEMGTGFRTYVSATAPYLLALALVLGFADLTSAVAAGAGFGAGRGILVWMRKWARDGDSWDELLNRRLAWIKPATTVVLLAVVLVRVGL